MITTLLSEKMSREEIRTKKFLVAFSGAWLATDVWRLTSIRTSARTPGNRKAAAERKERAPAAGTQSACTVLAISMISTGGAKAQS